MVRNPNSLVMTNIAQSSVHQVNTERIPTTHQGMKHNEGGWPAEIDPTEATDQAKYQKKMYRDPTLGFSQATKEMVGGATKAILQNNQIDLFEEYFAGEQPEHLSASINTKTLMIFKDPNNFKRSATKIAWHPETAEMRVGVTYSMLRFQQMPVDMPRESYIWNLNDPNFPEKTLLPPSPLCTMAFNHKNFDVVVGGSYNGSLSFFDTRAGNSAGVVKPFMTTLLEKSHADPVYDVYWLTLGKTGTECVSSSTDGRLLWWDINKKDQSRDITKPVDQLLLEEQVPNDKGETSKKVLGGTSLEYNSDAGPLKYLIGTEQGYVLQANKRKTIEVQNRYGYDIGKHHGPIYSLHRNPAHPKFFLSVGDWCAKIWSEEQKSPIMQTRYHSAYLTDGCWGSSLRCGLFFLTRIDGFLDIWDFYYKQNEVAFSQKISDSPLTSIAVNQNLAAIGDAEGTVYIMELCKSLYESTPKEKEQMAIVFDTEARREKNLEIAKKLANDEKNKQQNKKGAVDPEKLKRQQEEKLAEELKSIEENFFALVAKDDDINVIKARGEMQRGEPEMPSNVSEKSAGKVDLVELKAGQKYSLKTDDGSFEFVAEAGGIIAGDGINGSVQAGKILFTANGKEYEGSFASPNLANCSWKDQAGKTG